MSRFPTNYSHVNAISAVTFSVSIPLPIFDRNQGEIARTRFAITQAQEQQTAGNGQVLTDVKDAYEGLLEPTTGWSRSFAPAISTSPREAAISANMPTAAALPPARFPRRRAQLSCYPARLPSGARRLPDSARAASPSGGNQELAVTRAGLRSYQK